MARKRIREVELTIEGLSPEGLGTGRWEDRPVQLRNALPGEIVRGTVLKRHRGVLYAEAQTPSERSPLRTDPPCPFFPRCGGCVLQHVDYEAQLRHKQGLLVRELEASGVKPGRLRAPASGPRFHYRHKARLGVRVVGDRLLVGFRESFSNRVSRMDHCSTLARPFADALPALQQTLAELETRERIPQVELAAGDDQFAYVVRHLVPLPAADEARLREFARQARGIVYLQGGGYDSVRPLDPVRTPPTLSYVNTDYGLSYDFEPSDFTQVNPQVNRMLVRRAVLALEPLAGRTVADLFCGIGNFSLALARRGASVRGYESAPGAIARARANALNNGLAGNAEFRVADLYDAPGRALPEAQLLLLDPPRSGAGPNLDVWAAWPRLERIAYVSCNPVTFARDAKVLEGQGFTLSEAGILDMFPQTSHVETFGVFGRRA